MPTGAYVRTEESKKNSSEIFKLLWKNPEYRKKTIEARIGRIQSPETRKKISEANKGKHYRNHSIETRQKMSKSHMGKVHSEETKRKQSEVKKGTTHSNYVKKKISKNHADVSGDKNPMFGISGKKAPAWLGGLSFEPYSHNFNNQLKYNIRKRDNFTCQRCDKKENDNAHNCHHINYDKKNSSPRNLITLCDSCHSRTNSNREYWQDYFNNLGAIT